MFNPWTSSINTSGECPRRSNSARISATSGAPPDRIIRSTLWAANTSDAAWVRTTKWGLRTPVTFHSLHPGSTPTARWGKSSRSVMVRLRADHSTYRLMPITAATPAAAEAAAHLTNRTGKNLAGVRGPAAGFLHPQPDAARGVIAT